MIKVTHNLKEVTGAVKNMLVGTPKNAEDMLDQAGEEVKDKMAQESPILKGILRRSITVSRPQDFIREIEPLARNISGVGEKYAVYVEKGSKAGYWPNITSLKMYTGGDEKLAWAMAASIFRKGTSANPFISRTFNWTQGQLDKWGGVILAKMEVDFDKG